MSSSSGSSISAQCFLLTCIFSVQLLISSSALCVDSEREALIQFKTGLTDPGKRLSSWVGPECCEWSGISCNNKTGHVVTLDLHNPSPSGFSSLSGGLDPSLLHLNSLSYLDLSGNAFEQVSIPEFIGYLIQLRYLNISNAGFAGIIPAQLGNLSRLQYIDLSSGSLMVADFSWVSGLSSLIHLAMDQVDLSTIGPNWIRVLNSLSSLQELHLVACGLSAMSQSLPSTNLTSLSVIDLSFNSFSSVIPTWFLNLTSLVHLDLSDAGFHGSISGGLSDLPELKYLDLSLNGNLTADCSKILGGKWSRIENMKLGSNRVYGSLPYSIGNLTSLVELDLFDNNVEGGIPSSIGKLCNLKRLVLAGNNLTVGLPENLDKANGCMSEGSLQSLDYLFLSNNQIAGTLPEWLGELRSLVILNLAYNSIRGPIPRSLEKLSLLTELSLEGNQLNGTVPQALGGLTQLVNLDLSSNQLTGNITEAHFSKLSNLKLLIMSSNSLIINITSGWVPRFRVRNLGMGSCQLGPQFPLWIEGQSELEYLDFSGAGISGKIPTWFWDLSSNLSLLNISFNQIEGQLPIPTKVAAFADIDLRSNLLNGAIPTLTNQVELLDLSHNQFSGLIPANIGEVHPNLIYFSLSNNNIMGTIPSSIGEMQLLQVLDLSRNNIVGTIPQSLQNCSYLKALIIDHNNLNGDIRLLGNLQQLQTLHLSDNKLSGSVPESLKNCTSLETLDLSDNSLDGDIPDWIGRNFPTLRILRLRSNRFSGRIPPQLSNLSSLQVLDLAENELTGAIPYELGGLKAMAGEQRANRYLQFGHYRGSYYEESLWMQVNGRQLVYTKTLSLLTSIDLSRNNLTGEFPESLAGLFGLLVLNLSSNHLIGEIPKKIGQLREILSLDLSNNLLSGGIPSSMSSMSFMSYLNLSNNNFSGAIPYGGQFPTFDRTTYSGNPYLCGIPLVRCEKSSAHGGDDGSREKDDDDELFDDKWFCLSVVLGFLVGLLGLFASVLIRNSTRVAYFGIADRIIHNMIGVKEALMGARNQTQPRTTRRR